MTNEELKACCPLLPPPGEEVVKQLLEEINRLQTEVFSLKREMRRREDYIEARLL